MDIGHYIIKRAQQEDILSLKMYVLEQELPGQVEAVKDRIERMRQALCFSKTSTPLSQITGRTTRQIQQGQKNSVAPSNTQQHQNIYTFPLLVK